MTINHHISDESLLDFASGALGEAWSIAVATHLTLCSHCCDEISKMEALGGIFLSEIGPSSDTEDSLMQVMGKIDLFEDSPLIGANQDVPKVDENYLPQPLRGYLSSDLDNLEWRRLGLKAHQIILKTSDKSGTARLLKIPEGEPIPEHSHSGLEMTMVLSGAYSDSSGRYSRGDFQEADENVEHTPIVELGEDCICLIVTNAPLRFSNLTTRIVQPILGV